MTIHRASSHWGGKWHRAFRLSALLSVMLAALPGCADMGRVGSHPTLKTAYFDGNVQQTHDCLGLEAYQHGLLLEKDGAYSNGTRRFNLYKENEVVAWIEISHLNENRSNAYFYYNGKETAIKADILSMIDQCKDYEQKARSIR